VSARAFIAVGSNIDAERNVTAALELLGRHVRIVAVSRFYQTPALGAPGSPDFLNGVVEIETELEPLELKRLVLLAVESELGRERGGGDLLALGVFQHLGQSFQNLLFAFACHISSPIEF